MAEEKTCTQRIIKISSILMLLVFLAVFIIGVIGAVTMKSFGNICIGVIIFGIGGMVICLLGFVGSAAHPEQKGFIPLLFGIYYCGILFLCVVFMLYGIACFCVKPTLYYLMTLKVSEIREWFTHITEHQLRNFPQYIEKISKSLDAVGVICLLTGIILFFLVVVSTAHFRKRIFSTFFVGGWAVVLMLVGAVLSILMLMIQPHKLQLGGVEVMSVGIFSVVVAIGWVMLLDGIIGSLSAICGNKSKPLKGIFFAFSSLLVIAFFVFFILSLSLKKPQLKLIDDTCNVNIEQNKERYKQCLDVLDQLRNNTCRKLEADEVQFEACKSKIKMKDTTNKHKEMVSGWISLLAWISVFCIIFIIIVDIFAGFNLFRKSPEVKGYRKGVTNKGLPEYQPQKDISY